MKRERETTWKTYARWEDNIKMDLKNGMGRHGLGCPDCE
jgi:hypothetical protein